MNPLLNLEYRRRFWSGEVEARVGYTYEGDFDNDGDKFGDAASRGYVLANGRFNIDQNWRWGFGLEYASDDTFYRRPNPDASEYVKLNDKVKKGSVLCIIEAMKLMNEIESDVAGTVLAVLAEDGAPVEYDQPLFKIAVA